MGANLRIVHNAGHNMIDGSGKIPPVSPSRRGDAHALPPPPDEGADFQGMPTIPPHIEVLGHRKVLQFGNAKEVWRAHVPPEDANPYEPITIQPFPSEYPWNVGLPNVTELISLGGNRRQGGDDLSLRTEDAYQAALSGAIDHFLLFRAATNILLSSPHFFLADCTVKNAESVARWERRGEQGIEQLPQDLAAMKHVVFKRMVWERLIATVKLLSLPHEDVEPIRERALILASNLFDSIAPQDVMGDVLEQARVFFNAAYDFLYHSHVERSGDAMQNVKIAVQRVQRSIEQPADAIRTNHMVVPVHEDGSEGTMTSHTANPMDGAHVYTQESAPVKPISPTPAGRIIPFSRFK